MKTLVLFLCAASYTTAEVNFGPLAEANHNATPEQRASCDPDYGWLPGPEGSNKCYMFIKANGYDGTCTGSGDYYYGMTFFEGMECCYYQHGYLVEPSNEEETQMINTYLTIVNAGNNANTWWTGGTDMHNEWMDLECDQAEHMGYPHYTI